MTWDSVNTRDDDYMLPLLRGLCNHSGSIRVVLADAIHHWLVAKIALRGISVSV